VRPGQLLRHGGWVFGGLLLLAFAIAYSLLSILRLLRFPHAAPPPGTSWVRLLRQADHHEDDLRAAAPLLGTQTAAGEFEFQLFGKLHRRFPFVFTLIGAAPLLGLLGTVTGMFATFHGLSLSASRAPVDVISGGISEALITTQTGLIIAVPASILCSLLKIRADRRRAAFRKLALACRTKPDPLFSPHA
jgi:biopolymer transport protein ExbB